MNIKEYISPRVTGHTLKNYHGRRVILICEFISSIPQRGAVRVKAPDGMEVTVILPAGERFESKYAQVEGKVVNEGVIEGLKIMPGPETFEMEVYNKALEVLRIKVPELFHL